jgi:uncharacterized protein YjbI with pentapeptide repeats
LQELNEDKIQLVGVDVSSAFLQGIHLEHANLLRADLSAYDLRGSDFRFYGPHLRRSACGQFSRR